MSMWSATELRNPFTLDAHVPLMPAVLCRVIRAISRPGAKLSRVVRSYRDRPLVESEGRILVDQEQKVRLDPNCPTDDADCERK